jgi:hypothetical protein
VSVCARSWRRLAWSCCGKMLAISTAQDACVHIIGANGDQVGLAPLTGPKPRCLPPWALLDESPAPSLRHARSWPLVRASFRCGSRGISLRAAAARRCASPAERRQSWGRRAWQRARRLLRRNGLARSSRESAKAGAPPSPSPRRTHAPTHTHPQCVCVRAGCMLARARVATVVRRSCTRWASTGRCTPSWYSRLSAVTGGPAVRACAQRCVLLPRAWALLARLLLAWLWRTRLAPSHLALG